MPELVLFMKPRCHLCHDAAQLLSRLGEEYGFTFREIDITGDPDLYGLYGDYIPVVAVNGQAALMAPFGEPEARAMLQRLIKRADP